MKLGGQINSAAHTGRFAGVHARRRGIEVIVESGLIHELGIALEVRRKHGIRLVGQRAWTNENVVPDNRWLGHACCDVEKCSAVGSFIDERVVYDKQFVTGVCRIGTFEAVGDDRTVVGIRSLLDQVADDERASAIGQVDLVAARAVFLREAVVENPRLGRARLEQVSNFAAVRVVVLEDEFGDVVDVEVVALPVAETVVRKLGALDRDGAVRIVAGENPVLVVVEVATANRQIGAFLPNACAVLIGHRCPDELDVLDDRVVASDDPSRLAARVFPGRIDLRQTPNATKSQAVFAPTTNIPRITPRIDLDQVSVTRRRDGRARSSVGFSRTNLQRRCRSKRSRRHASENQESSRTLHRRPHSLSVRTSNTSRAARRASATNLCIKPSSLMPGSVSTPLATSTPYGRT